MVLFTVIVLVDVVLGVVGRMDLHLVWVCLTSPNIGIDVLNFSDGSTALRQEDLVRHEVNRVRQGMVAGMMQVEVMTNRMGVAQLRQRLSLPSRVILRRCTGVDQIEAHQHEAVGRHKHDLRDKTNTDSLEDVIRVDALSDGLGTCTENT